MKLQVELESKEMLTPIGFAEAVIDYWLPATADPDESEIDKVCLWEIARHIEMFLKADRRMKDLKVSRVLENGKI